MLWPSRSKALIDVNRQRLTHGGDVAVLGFIFSQGGSTCGIVGQFSARPAGAPAARRTLCAYRQDRQLKRTDAMPSETADVTPLLLILAR